MRTQSFGRYFIVELHHSPFWKGMTYGPTDSHVSTYLLDENLILSGTDIADKLYKRI